MLTRRENLLVRPWQERRYINHRIKVERATPAIDTATPAPRHHVACKLKKHQRERERCGQIVSDNFTLLQHLHNIRATSRVDNFWDEPPPNFLNRVGIYCTKRRVRRESEEPEEELEPARTRKDRCHGCSPHRYLFKVEIPEERIPFPPPKKNISRKLRSPPELQTLPQLELKSERRTQTSYERKEGCQFQERGKVRMREEGQEQERGKVGRKEGGQERGEMTRKARRALRHQTQSLLLSRGPVTFRLLFPTDTGLVFNDKGQARVLSRQACYCASRKH